MIVWKLYATCQRRTTEMHYFLDKKDTLQNSPAATLPVVHLKQYYTKLRKHRCPDHARFPPLLAHDSEAPAGVEVIVFVTLQHG